MKKAFYQFKGDYLPNDHKEREIVFENWRISSKYIKLHNIFIDVLQIESIDESNRDDYLTIKMIGGNAYIIKWKLTKLLRLIKNSE